VLAHGAGAGMTHPFMAANGARRFDRCGGRRPVALRVDITTSAAPSLIRLWNETNIVRVDNGIDSSLIRRDLAVEDEHRETMNKRPGTKRE
jgi:hypothetical protein